MKIKDLNPKEKELIEIKAKRKIKNTKLLGKGSHGEVWRILFEDRILICYKKDTEFTRIEKEGKKNKEIYKNEGTELIGEGVNSEGIFIPYLGRPISWKIILKMPNWARVCLCYQITQALAAVHQHNIIHRDLKKNNIVLNQEGETPLIDFGRSVYLDEDTSLFSDLPIIFYPFRAIQLLIQEQVAPEYCWINGKIDLWSDVYSLGVIFKKILFEIPGAHILYQSCLSRDPQERPTLNLISNYLMNSLLRDCLFGFQNQEDFLKMMGNFFKPINKLLYLQEKKFNQEESSNIREKLGYMIEKNERSILSELESKLNFFYEILKTKYWKDRENTLKYKFFHTGYYVSKLRLIGENLRFVQKCMQEENRDGILSVLIHVYESLQTGSLEWISPKQKKIHEIIELCSQSISLLIAKNVFNNQHAFSDHLIKIQLIEIQDEQSSSRGFNFL